MTLRQNLEHTATAYENQQANFERKANQAQDPQQANKLRTLSDVYHEFSRDLRHILETSN